MKTQARIRAQILAVLSLPALSACSSGTLPDYNILGDLRILALKADQPEVDPTSSPTVNLTPVVSDLNLGRSLSWAAVGCVDPGVGYGAKPSCTGVPGAVNLGGAAFADPDPTPTKLTHTGPAPSFSVTIPSAIFTGRNSVDQFNGIAYLVIYTLTATAPGGSTAQVVSFKRIIASATAHTPKNTNPVLTDVTAGTQSLTTFLSTLTYPGGAVALAPVFGPGSTETYQLQGSNGTSTLTETLTTTWFISDGSTTFFRTLSTDSNTWTPPAVQPVVSGSSTQRGIVIFAVTRDGRGGEDFKQFEF